MPSKRHTITQKGLLDLTSVQWRRLAALLALALAACGGETGPAVGAIRFIAHMDGAEADRDTDGFEVSGLPGALPIAVPAGTGVTIGGLPAEELDVTLGGIAENCGVADGETRTITVVPEDTVQVSWLVTCGQRPATVTVGFVTPADAAAGWLTVALGERTPTTLQAGDEVVFDHLAPGAYQLEISESPNCRVEEPLVSTVHLVSGAETFLVLRGACSSGRIVFDVGQRLWRVNPDGTELSEVSGLSDIHAMSPSLSPGGGEIAFTLYSLIDASRSLTITDWGATNLEVVTSMTNGPYQPAWSPDGSQIAFIAADPATESWDIFVIDRDGSNLRNVTNSRDQEDRPTWTRDGSRILYSAGHTGRFIYTIRPDGTDRDSLGEGSNPILSPTSDIIALFSDGVLKLMDPDGQNVRTVPGPFNVNGPLTWSPDGRLLVFYSGATPRNGITTVDLTGRMKVLVPYLPGMNLPTVSWGQ